MEIKGENILIDERFKVIEEIGGGGFGKVLKVIDEQSGEELALKYCTSDLDENIRRFKREIRIMEEIEHENVIKISYSNVEYDPPYFTMPIALYPITQIIDTLKADIPELILLFESVCKGINAIHNSGHTHRDIKPDNILVYDNSHIVVSDLGLAKSDVRDTTILTRANIYMGTYDYMPPEQLMQGGTRDLDHRGDVFQLGKTLYHLLTGERPSLMNPKAVPTGIWYVIQKATKQIPEDRYQSVNELLDALQDAMRALDPSRSPTKIYEDLLKEAVDNLENDEYDKENISKLIQLIYTIDNQMEYINLFHKIPNRILQIYASNMPAEFEPIIEKYREAIDKEVGGYPFEFAESVAHKMKIVFKNTCSAYIKKEAIISILIAGKRLNRWSAMGTFDVLLKSIDNDESAYPVAEGLNEKIYDYKKLYDRIPKKELHPAIQIVWEKCEVD